MTRVTKERYKIKKERKDRNYIPNLSDDNKTALPNPPSQGGDKKALKSPYNQGDARGISGA